MKPSRPNYTGMTASPFIIDKYEVSMGALFGLRRFAHRALFHVTPLALRAIVSKRDLRRFRGIRGNRPPIE